VLTTAQNEQLTRVGAGTPMGELMRRYWMPAMLSFELPEPDCAPVRIRLLSESLVGFRDTSGRIGVVAEMCPHRGASLWLGRNEADGLRCVYHGWKFDVTGQCVDQMNEPGQSDFAAKVKVRAYPTEEFGGIIWIYMGPPDMKPALPKFAWTQVPEPHRYVTKVREECNWLQALEGGIDTSHAPIMHRALRKETAALGIPMDGPFVRGSAPTLELEYTDYGYRYFGIRDMPEGGKYVRGYHFVMPFTQLRPNSPKQIVDGHYWVPIDDESVMVYNFGYSYGEQPLTLEDSYDRNAGNNFGTDIDIDNGFRSVRNAANNWMIDRAIQKTDTFTGIKGINAQDRAVQESMGKIMDRTQEHLGAADKAIISTRRLLQHAVDAVADGGDPPGVAPTYYQLRAIDDIVPDGTDWHAMMMGLMYPTDPAASLR
jgi:phthalate 4,5-dioxygenase oxygenase subunit